MDVGVKGLDAKSNILVPMKVLYLILLCVVLFTLQHISISNIYYV